MAVHTMSEARANLAALLDAVERGEDVVITRHGRPAARLVQPASWSDRTADLMYAASRLAVEMAPAWDEPLPPAQSGEGPTADELVEALRRDRDSW
ncbi:MAG: type II toxin-antitoxin system Phd/YefM family antitoxin [Aeromicrobium sp.]|uniref:type II toxin-antitoxin system Phd/YefM family antitoxin n=1 Tax=Aeromicrobium sp. TaxID=1871063 RepID=UPI0039E58561